MLGIDLLFQAAPFLLWASGFASCNVRARSRWGQLLFWAGNSEGGFPGSGAEGTLKPEGPQPSLSPLFCLANQNAERLVTCQLTHSQVGTEFRLAWPSDSSSSLIIYPAFTLGRVFCSHSVCLSHRLSRAFSTCQALPDRDRVGDKANQCLFPRSAQAAGLWERALCQQ